jgi:hypothetical protein
MKHTIKRWPQDVLFPRQYFRNRVHGIPAVPAYFHHQIDAREFTKICREITQRGFQTLKFSQLLDGSPIDGSALLLTMDDGWSSVWSVAFPIAKRYGIHFTLFVVPDLMEITSECRPTLYDGLDPASLVMRDMGPRRWLTWGEIWAMHASGLVDVQSHSMNHGVVFSSNSCKGFCTSNGPFPLYGMAPLVNHISGKDIAEMHPAPGAPLYSLSPALAASRRFIQEPDIRERCVELVRKNGGEKFFASDDWRAKLLEVVKHGGNGQWETKEERRERFRSDLFQSRLTIESRIPGANVRVLATPWAAMHPELPAIARETGYEVIVLGYPFPDHPPESPLPLYPRLKGDSIWPLLHGPFIGSMGWLKARNYHIRRNAAGAVS